MSKILWRKTYALNHKKGSFWVYVSKHTHGLFYSSIVYHTRKGNWSNGESVYLELMVQTFYAKREKEAYDKCLKWVDKNLGKEYKIKIK